MSSDNMIISGVELDVNNDLKYSKVKINPSGGKSVGILNAHTNTATYISTPILLTWGVNTYTDDRTGKCTYDLSLQFPSSEYHTADSRAFLDNMKQLEEKIKSDAVLNSKEWFGKTKMSSDAVDALFTPILRYPKDQQTGDFDLTRSPTLRVKLPFWEDEWKFELYDLDRNAIFPDPTGNKTPLDIISKGSNIATVLQCGGVWFANGKFGMTWKLFQGVVKPKATLKGKCHITLSTDEKNRLLSEKSNDDEESGVEIEDDSDIEEEAKKVVSEALVESEEPKKVKKKVVRKKSEA